MNHYQEAFPDFPDLDIRIPAGFVDSSWHNDISPSFTKRLENNCVLQLFVDYPEKSMSEFSFQSDAEWKRFRLYFSCDDDLSSEKLLVESNNFADVLAALSSY